MTSVGSCCRGVSLIFSELLAIQNLRAIYLIWITFLVLRCVEVVRTSIFLLFQ